jgi:hypothetical protein
MYTYAEKELLDSVALACSVLGPHRRQHRSIGLE